MSKITLIPWKNAYYIDHGIIDNDHKTLVSLANDVLSDLHSLDMLENLVPRLNYIRSFAIAHFAREESLQTASRYPALDEHRIQHRRLISVLDEFIEAIASGRLEGVEHSAGSRMIRSFFYNWLLSHIMEEDVKLRPFVEAMAEAATNLTPLRVAS